MKISKKISILILCGLALLPRSSAALNKKELNAKKSLAEARAVHPNNRNEISWTWRGVASYAGYAIFGVSYFLSTVPLEPTSPLYSLRESVTNTGLSLGATTIFLEKATRSNHPTIYSLIGVGAGALIYNRDPFPGPLQ